MTGNVLLYSSAAGIATLIGIGLLRFAGKRALQYSHRLNSLAAGFILAVAFFHLLPEAADLAEDAMLFAALGFAVFYVLEAVLVVHSGVEIHFQAGDETARKRPRAMVAFSGLLFHSLLDGVIIAVAFQADEHMAANLGLLTAISVILHELPEGITTFSLLMKSVSQKTAMWMSVAVALATPAGAALSLVIIPDVSQATVGKLVALAAGSFLYIGASDLVPETHGKHGIRNALYLLAGAAAIYVVGILMGGGGR